MINLIKKPHASGPSPVQLDRYISIAKQSPIADMDFSSLRAHKHQEHRVLYPKHCPKQNGHICKTQVPKCTAVPGKKRRALFSSAGKLPPATSAGFPSFRIWKQYKWEITCNP